MTAIAPIYFVVFVLMAQFVLVNVVVAVLMKKLDVNKKNIYYLFYLFYFLKKESKCMMADDAEIDEEIERQLEADAQDRNYVEQPLLDDKEFDVSEYFI
jgi:voltage-dependent calcium channel T type alpha-1G